MALAPAQRPRSGGRKEKDHDGMSSDEWCSPPEIADPLYDFSGIVFCDPCSNDRSLIRARKRYTEGGLVLPWGTGDKNADDGYANWPYSQNDAWSAKAILEMRVQRIRELTILCMTATSTIWWQNLMHKPKRNPRVILTKRLKFLGPTGVPMDSSRFEPALIYYGARHASFDKHFRHVTMWSTWGR